MKFQCENLLHGLPLSCICLMIMLSLHCALKSVTTFFMLSGFHYWDILWIHIKFGNVSPRQVILILIRITLNVYNYLANAHFKDVISSHQCT